MSQFVSKIFAATKIPTKVNTIIVKKKLAYVKRKGKKDAKAILL